MNFTGVFHGIMVFLLIGVFHPIVIKAEYYLGRKSIGLFVVLGIITLGLALVVQNITGSTVLATFAFCCFWSIKEVIEQEQRVLEGRFPRNPNRVYKIGNNNKVV